MMRAPVASGTSRRRMSASDEQTPAPVNRHGEPLALASNVRALKARRAILPAGVTADEAFWLTLQHCKWHVAANVASVVECREVEGVHQIRVALRRLRVALAAFGEEFRTPPLEALRVRAKILAQGLAPARDLDVFMDELLEPAARANGAVGAFSILRDRALAARREAWSDAVREVSGLGFRTFLHDLGEAVDERIWRERAHGGASGSGLAAFDAPAIDLAARMLSRRLKAAKRHARNLNSLSETERHGLRIALKKLRYTAEFFAPLYPASAAGPFLKRLSRMQDILGLLQDVAVARAILGQLVEEPQQTSPGPRADVSFAAGIVYGWHLDRATSAWRDAVKRWKGFARTEPFWPAG